MTARWVSGLAVTGRWILGLLRYSIISVIGLWALANHLHYRIPGPVLFLLPWLSLALLALSVLMLANHFVPRGWMPEPARQAFDRTEYWGSLAILIFACWSLVVFVNGFADRSRPAGHRSEVQAVARNGLRIKLGTLTPVSWVTLRSVRDPQRVERVSLWWNERNTVWVGKTVVVRMRQGALGIPWVAGIEDDVETHHRTILAMSPTATYSWRALILYYLQERRVLEAAQLARQYRDLAPYDVLFFTNAAAMLGERGMSAEVVTILEPLAKRSDAPPNLHVYLGMALALTGEQERGVAMLQKALEKDPNHLVALYGLAELYEARGPDEKSLEYWDRLLALSPDLADAPERAAKVRTRLGRATQGSGGSQAPQKR
ncbi:MAG: tetratricopeptide repeat protein [Thermoanaerobaculia bacterium]